MIRKLAIADFPAILNVINDAAQAYKGRIPKDRWKEPYMPATELEEEIDSGVQFYGYFEKSALIAVMGIQRISSVTLVRHAYVLKNYQRKGLGEKLLRHLLSLAQTSTIYVGTWEAASWAIKFYEKYGFKLLSTEEKNKLLRKYWSIPKRQVQTSVVLEQNRQLQLKQTLFLRVNPKNPEMAKIQTAAQIIRKGGLVAFPTETVYGLGANALNSDAVAALFEAKKRPLDNPPIVHVASPSEVHRLAREVPKKAELLMEKFWPGPLTLVFKRSRIVPNVTVAGLDTIAIRMPKHRVALALIKESGCPIAAPSANLAGKPSPTIAHHVCEDLDGRIDAIIDSGPTNIGVESTVVDISVDSPMVLRPGGTTLEALEQVLGEVKVHPFVQAEQELPLEKISSPGMKHRHYAPKAEVILVEGAIPAVIKKIQELTESFKLKGVKVGILATDETQTSYKAMVVKSLGSRLNLPLIAQNLFRLLREVDEENVGVILAEGVGSEEMGLAIMNRLRKASGYHIIKAE